MPRITELCVPEADAELAADRLWIAGARAVEQAGDAGRAVLRTVLASDDDVSRERLGALPDGWALTFHDQPDAPVETWREFVAPIQVSPTLVIRPAWLDGAGVAIEPGGAFGLGDHPTTRLSAAAVERLTGEGSGVTSLLDVGCGSGVLAIVAAVRGVERVVAIDISEAAREATVANAGRNGVANRIAVATTPLDRIDGVYDVVVANILAPTLVSLADDLRRVTAPGGTLVISGVLESAYDHVLAALAPLRVVRADVLDGWAAVELRR